MNARFLFLPLIAVGALLFVSGCSSISVQPKSSAVSSHEPRRIVVAPFTFADQLDQVRVDRTGQRLQDFKRDLSGKMDESLVEELRRFGIPVEQISSAKAPPGTGGWLVQGQFTRVNQGGRALRIVVGMGAGGTKLETRVRIKDIGSGRTVFGFRTTGGSNINSGIITSYGPLTLATAGGALFDVVVSAGKGLTDDTHRTAKMIADYISQQLATSGAIPQSKAREPKILNGPVDALGSLRN
jgi:hypothetical protein